MVLEAVVGMITVGVADNRVVEEVVLGSVRGVVRRYVSVASTNNEDDPSTDECRATIHMNQ